MGNNSNKAVNANQLNAIIPRGKDADSRYQPLLVKARDAIGHIHVIFNKIGMANDT